MEANTASKLMTMPIYVHGKSPSQALSEAQSKNHAGRVSSGNPHAWHGHAAGSTSQALSQDHGGTQEARRSSGNPAPWHAQTAGFQATLGEVPTEVGDRRRCLGTIRSDAHLQMFPGKDAILGSVAVWGEHMLNHLPDPIFGETATQMMSTMQSKSNQGPWDDKCWAHLLENCMSGRELDSAAVFEWTFKTLRSWAPGFSAAHVGANGGDALFWGVTFPGYSVHQVLIGLWHYGGNDGKWPIHARHAETCTSSVLVANPMIGRQFVR
jgi:hypothetical protein